MVTCPCSLRGAPTLRDDSHAAIAYDELQYKRQRREEEVRPSSAAQIHIRAPSPPFSAALATPASPPPLQQANLLALLSDSR